MKDLENEFYEEKHEELAKLSIDPELDSILRIFMVYRGLDDPIHVEEQKLEPFERNGFTAVEWGGTEIKYLG